MEESRKPILRYVMIHEKFNLFAMVLNDLIFYAPILKNELPVQLMPVYSIRNEQINVQTSF